MAAIAAFNARRVSILTPYTREVNEQVAGYFAGRGLEVLNIAGFDIESDADMSCVSLESIYRAAVEICHPEAELLFISCTALRASRVAERIEASLGRPVVTSNQAMAWHALD